MVSRSHCAYDMSPGFKKGQMRLTLAKIIVSLEHRLKTFLHPLALVGLFVALAWTGVLSSLYPWAHLVGLAFFITYFGRELGHARAAWKVPDASLARRRVEEASGLKHHPLDVLNDRPAAATEAQKHLWDIHHARAVEQVKNLRWPTWKLTLAAQDPHGLRYALLGLLLVGLAFGWGGLGKRVMTALNPAVGKWAVVRPTLDAWITPPDTTHMPPMMIATPAGLRHDKDVLNVPEGSTISAHLPDMSGDTPTLTVNGKSQDFIGEDGKDFAATSTVTNGTTISIRRGWQVLGSWHIHVVPDNPPHIAFAAPPSVTERKAVAIPFEATDDYGVTSVKLRITPHESLPGYDLNPIDVTLGTTQNRSIKRTAYEDLTAHPWAGLPVKMELVATDTAGHESVSASADLVLPERDFLNPYARALIDERRKLLQSPFDDTVRGEVANVMASVAHKPASYRGDPVVLMALRTGAVQLVLDRDHETTPAVNNILWQSAMRIEGGTTRSAEDALREAQKDLADALDHNASTGEVQRIVNRMHEALAQYMAELATRSAGRPGPTEDLSAMLGADNKMMSPDDLHRMIDEMSHLSATGSRDAAREELARMQQMMENMHTDPVALSAEQRAALQTMKSLQGIIKDQQKLIDQTFQNSTQTIDKSRASTLTTVQNDLSKRLRDLMPQMKGAQGNNLAHGGDAMQRAGALLKHGESSAALSPENEALKALQDAAHDMQEALRQELFMLPRPGLAGADPFGRDGNSMMRDDGSVQVPDQMEVRRVREILDELQRRSGDFTRPKTEREYIDRLLQDF